MNAIHVQLEVHVAVAMKILCYVTPYSLVDGSQHLDNLTASVFSLHLEDGGSRFL
jgi:hypothetical protein